MTSVKEKLRKAVFGKLRTLRRKLTADGIPCNYTRSVLSHDAGEIGFRITCGIGDSALLPRLSLRIGSTIEEFDNTNFEQGLARLKELVREQIDTETSPAPA